MKLLVNCPVFFHFIYAWQNQGKIYILIRKGTCEVRIPKSVISIHQPQTRNVLITLPENTEPANNSVIYISWKSEKLKSLKNSSLGYGLLSFLKENKKVPQGGDKKLYCFGYCDSSVKFNRKVT